MGRPTQPLHPSIFHNIPMIGPILLAAVLSAVPSGAWASANAAASAAKTSPVTIGATPWTPIPPAASAPSLHPPGAPGIGLPGTLPRPGIAGLELPRSAPVAAGAYKPITQRDPDTRLYGVNAEKAKALADIVRKHYGDDLLDLAVVGSRASGISSKRLTSVHEASDLDLVPLIRRGAGGRGELMEKIAKEARELLGCKVEVHTVLDIDDRQGFGTAVPFYGGGGESYHSFSNDEAVRIPL